MASTLNRYSGLADLVVRARRDTAAADALKIVGRAFTGATSADAPDVPAWVATEAQSLVHPMAAAFAPAGPLPKSGLSVEYITSRTETLTGNAMQATEGNDTASLRLVLEDGLAAVKTIALHSEMSEQAQRDTDYVAEVLEAQMRHYTARVGAAVRETLVAMAPAVAATVVSGDLSKADVNRSAVLDAVDAISDAEGEAAVVLLPRADFRRIAAIVDADGRSIFVPEGDLGRLNGARIAGRIAHLPILVDKGLAAGTGYVADPAALRVLQTTPVDQLAKLDPRNLSAVAALTGYVAVTKPHPALVRRIAFTA